LVNTLRRWNATVRGEIQHAAATSLLGRPWATSWAMCSSVGVSSTDQEDHVRRYIAFLRPFNDTTQGQEKPS
jgi:hypothetical protein